MKKPRPPWLKAWLRIGNTFRELEKIIEIMNLNTVCREAFCPNMGECFNDRTVTFLILGNRCSRKCSFCGVKKGNMLAPDTHERGKSRAGRKGDRAYPYGGYFRYPG